MGFPFSDSTFPLNITLSPGLRSLTIHCWPKKVTFIEPVESENSISTQLCFPLRLFLNCKDFTANSDDWVSPLIKSEIFLILLKSSCRSGKCKIKSFTVFKLRASDIFFTGQPLPLFLNDSIESDKQMFFRFGFEKLGFTSEGNARINSPTA